MPRADMAPRADDPKTKVDRILADLIGRDYDLLTDKGRTEAIEAIEAAPPEGEAAPSAPTAPEVPDGDTRSAWEAARGLCAEVQIGAALTRLSKLEPLPDEDGDPMAGDGPVEFETARRQVGEQLDALRDEYAGDNNREVIENVTHTLFGGARPLFDQLREAGNYVPAHVNDRSVERHVIHYMAIRGFAAQLCHFGLDCDRPTTEPEGESGVGQALGATERAIRCVRQTGRRLADELEALGLAADCTLDTIPGVEFQGDIKGEPEKPRKGGKSAAREDYSEPRPDPEQPSAYDLFRILGRVQSEADDWLAHLDRDGKRGARLIRSEVDRLATKSQQFRPKPPPDPTNEPPAARLLTLFVAELDRASREIGRLLDV